MDVQLVITKGGRSQTIRLQSEETIVGRRQGCDLRIPAASVSRRHCRLTIQNGQLMVEDLDSANGTYVNGARVREPQAVQPGDRLEIGPVIFLVKYQISADDEIVDVEAVGRVSRDGLPVFDMEDLETVNEEAPRAIASSRTPSTVKGKNTKVPAESKAPPPPELKQPTVVDAEFLDESSWHATPDGEDIRDILSEMDDAREEK